MTKEKIMTIINIYQNYYNDFKNVLSENELNFIKKQKNTSKGFLKIWTQKEAVLKGKGTGIRGKAISMPTTGTDSGTTHHEPCAPNQPAKT